MKLPSLISAPLGRAKAWFGTWFGSIYDAVTVSPHRSWPHGSRPRDAKRDLVPFVRGELVRRSRYIHKNSGFSRELVANMHIYSAGTGIKVHARSADDGWNKLAEDLFQRWCRRCEITGRFTFGEVQALVCRGVDVDGEYFLHKVKDANNRPCLQLLESHRIGSPDPNAPDAPDGIGVDAVGAPLFYRVVQDDGSTIDVPANLMLHVFEPEDASAVRCAPTYQHSINHILDEMDLLALEKHAVKDNADIARIIKRANEGDLNDEQDFALTPRGNPPGPRRKDKDGKPLDGFDDEDEFGRSDPINLQRIIGGKVVSLAPGEDVDTFVSNRPSPTFTGFLEHLRRDAALGVVPFEFAADSSAIGGAGVRLVVAKADRRFEWRSHILCEKLVRECWLFVIGDAITRKQLAPIVDWDKIAFTTPRRITVDAGRESQQNRADVETGLKTLHDHFAEQGKTFEQELEVRARNAKAIKDAAEKYGVPLSMLWNPTGGTQPTPAIGEPDPEAQPPPPGRAQAG
jgi:capsid protein